MLPPLPEVISGLEKIYQAGTVTNMGPLHNELESRLKARLRASNLVLFNNGTLALTAALNALQLPPGSEVITTPFSFAATTHAIVAAGLIPVFADVEPTFFTIDPQSVRQKITSRTSCILAVHVYGFPCFVEELGRIAMQSKLRVVYDAAHAFGVEVHGQPIASYGDANVFSFHATKLFNSIEGGCATVSDPALKDRLKNYRNFGILSEERVASVGLNGKMSEVHALFGLLNLPLLETEMNRRAAVREAYVAELRDCPQIVIPREGDHVLSSRQYFPIRVLKRRDYVYKRLKEFNVFSRRYFFPLISDFECYSYPGLSAGLPVAQQAAREVLCLPFYGDLINGAASRIGRLVREILCEPQGETG